MRDTIIKACGDCGKPLSAVNRSGYCRQHFGALHNSERTREQNRRQWSDPALRARIMRPLLAYNRERLSWCPLEYRNEYRRLTRVKHYSAADARVMIEATVTADVARYARTGQLQQSVRG